MKNPKSPKERNLIKGSLRRVFSRSDLRRDILKKHLVEHSDARRPRVKKWAWCGECGEIVPAYLTQTDHIIPLIELNKSLEDYTWDEIVDRLWCEESNLIQLCVVCHKKKSLIENAERRKLRKKAV